MNTRFTFKQIATITVATLAIGASQAQRQGIAASNAAFDAKFNAHLGAMQRQNAQWKQALWQDHLQVNGPRLRQQYAQMQASGRANITFQQFTYWDLTTAAGTNVQGALQHQQNNSLAFNAPTLPCSRATSVITRVGQTIARDNRR